MKNKIISFLIYFFMAMSLLPAQSGAELLDGYVKEALRVNPAILSAQKEIEIVRQKAHQYSGLPDPQITAGIAIRPIETRLGPQDARFRLVQSFPWFGTLGARYDELESAANERENLYESIRQEIVFSVRELWLHYFLKQSQMESFENQINAYRMLEAQSVESLANDRLGFVEMIRIRNGIIHLETRIRNLNEEAKAIVVTFNTILHRDHDRSIDLPDTLNFSNDQLPHLDQVISLNPSLQSLLSRELSISYRKDYHRLNRRPRFGVGLDYSLIGKRVDADPIGNGEDALAAFFSMSLPLYSGKYDAASEGARLEAIQVKFDQEKLKNELRSAYGYALSRYNIAYQEEEKLRQQISNTKSALSILENTYEGGRNIFRDIIDLRNSLYEMEFAQQEMSIRQLVAGFKIEQLAGNAYRNLEEKNNEN